MGDVRRDRRAHPQTPLETTEVGGCAAAAKHMAEADGWGRPCVVRRLRRPQELVAMGFQSREGVDLGRIAKYVGSDTLVWEVGQSLL